MKVAMATLGCKVNQYESAGILEALEDRGFSIVPFNTAADYYIVNTCTVTGRSDYQSRQLIRRAIRINPRASIIVTGCYARIAPDEIRKITGVTLVMETKEAIAPMLQDIASGKLDPTQNPVRPDQILTNLQPKKFPGHTRAFLKIQDGCNTFCTYCIVPYARGPSRSLSEKDVVSRIHDLQQAGFREIVLTGIHLGVYGLDLCPPSNLLNILKKVEEKRSIERLRLSSIEPGEISDEMIAFFRSATVLCHHLHIPLQSGSDDILKRMGRPYHSAFFRNRLEKIWRTVPDMAIGMDVMVGFPGEDETAFNRTLQLIEDLPVAYLHVFPYSERPGTAASMLSGKVRETDKKIRAEQLRSIGKKKRAAFAEKFVGKKLAVLIEGTQDPLTGFMKGFSDHYIPVFIHTRKPSLANQIVEVIPETCEDGKLYSRMVHD
jgi:threonylcarbamoyladenosine tRNA methylthiotransferase MtaB